MFQTTDDTLEKAARDAIQFSKKHYEQLLLKKSSFRVIDEETDAVIIKAFRDRFKDLNVQTIDENALFGGLNNIKWNEIKKILRKSISQFRDRTIDMDLLTLLRIDARMGYAESNTVMVNRLKFLVIECCRSKENLNIVDPEAVTVDETKRVVTRLRRAFHELKASSYSQTNVRNVVNRITQLRMSLPVPSPRVLKESGIGKYLNQVAKMMSKQEGVCADKIGDAVAVITEALNAVLGQWKLSVMLQREERRSGENEIVATLAGKLLDRLGRSSRTHWKVRAPSQPNEGEREDASKHSDDNEDDAHRQNASTKEDTFDALCRWAETNGATCENTLQTIVDADGVRGLGVKTDVVKGDTLYRVPLTLCLSLESALRSDIQDVCRAVAFEKNMLTFRGVSLDSTGKDWALALFIAHERVKSLENDSKNWGNSGNNKRNVSFYTPWLRAMPSDYSTCLGRWSDEELVMLQSPELRTSALRAKALRRTVWSQIHALIKKMSSSLSLDKENSSTCSSGTPRSCSRLADVTFDDFEWGWFTIRSRGAACCATGTGTRNALGNADARTSNVLDNIDDNFPIVLPVFDLMNHKSDSPDEPSPIFRFDSPRKVDGYPSIPGFLTPRKLVTALPPAPFNSFFEALDRSLPENASSAEQEEIRSRALAYAPGYDGTNEERSEVAPCVCDKCGRWSTIQEGSKEHLWLFEQYMCSRCTQIEEDAKTDPKEWLPSDIVVTASRNYRRGDQICFPYKRSLCSYDLLIRYGFLPNPANDAVREDDLVILELPNVAVVRIFRSIASLSVDVVGGIAPPPAIADAARDQCKRWSYTQIAESPLNVESVPKQVGRSCAFWASPRWVGRREGRVFKRDLYGTGYYIDNYSNKDHNPVSSASSSSAATIVVEHIVPGDQRAITLYPGAGGVGNGWSKTSLSYFRALVADETHLGLVRKSQSAEDTCLDAFTDPICFENELAALRALRDFVRARLDLCGTTIEEDVKEYLRFATNGDNTVRRYRKALALQFRIDQKRIMRSHVNALSAAISIAVSAPDESVRSRLARAEKLGANLGLSTDELTEILLYLQKWAPRPSNIPPLASICPRKTVHSVEAAVAEGLLAAFCDNLE
eukprot:g594.t1